MGQHSEIIGAVLADTKWRRGRFEEVYNVPGNIADNFPLAQTMPSTILIGATAARDVLMPAAAASMHGMILTITSKSSVTTGVLTLKTSTDAALSPAVSMVQFASVEMQYFHGIGWRKKGG